MSDHATAPIDLVGPVHVVGAGLLGTSLGLALRRFDIEVWLSDRSLEHVRTASGLGAGIPAPADTAGAQLTVIAVPPNGIAAAVARALEDGSGVVTDVGSIKGELLEKLIDLVDDTQLTRYVGGHPMAGSERSGPLAGSAALFDGRPWAVTPHVHSEARALHLVEELVRACGAETIRLSPVEHDCAVARTSHLPHLLAVLAAGQLADARPEHLTLSGQGVRDVTRIAAGDPTLWGQIIRANAPAVTELLREVQGELAGVLAALEDPDALEEILTRGVHGTQAIPGKHGGRPDEVASVFVAVPDTPGELARLVSDVAEIGVNIEDLRIDHDPARPRGLVELIVDVRRIATLAEALQSRAWVLHR